MVGKLVRRTQRFIVGAARAEDGLRQQIREHLGTDGSSVDVVEETWASYEHVNVQVGLDAWLEAPGREHTLVGVGHFRHREFVVRPHAFLGAQATGHRSRQRGEAQPAGRALG